jgi:hypothetical protein
MCSCSDNDLDAYYKDVYAVLPAGEGDVKVCTTSCYTAINGVGWRNWGLTLMEQAERYVKHVWTDKEPERTLPIPDTRRVVLEVTARGR